MQELPEKNCDREEICVIRQAATTWLINQLSDRSLCPEQSRTKSDRVRLHWRTYVALTHGGRQQTHGTLYCWK